MKTVIITGALGGIGYATSELFYNNGWKVVGTDLKPADRNLPFELHRMNVASQQDVSEFFDKFSDSNNHHTHWSIMRPFKYASHYLKRRLRNGTQSFQIMFVQYI